MSTIKKSGGNLSLELSVFVFKDTDYPNGDMFIAYCPELDLSGYDDTEEKARNSFEFVLNDYLEYTTKNGTLEQDLLNHGWRKYKNGKFVEPTYPTMLKSTQLKSVLDQKRFSKYSMPVTV